MATVLCLDDDMVIAQMVGRMATLLGHTAFVETSSIEAVTKYARAQIGVAIIDYMLPKLDGIEVLAAFMESSPKTRRILLTAAPSEQAVSEAVSAGIVQLVIAKPPTLTDLEYVLAWL